MNSKPQPENTSDTPRLHFGRTDMESTTPAETKPAETPTGLCLEAFADAALPSAGEELEIIISEHPMPELVIDGDTENFIFRVNEWLTRYILA